MTFAALADRISFTNALPTPEMVYIIIDTYAEYTDGGDYYEDDYYYDLSRGLFTLEWEIIGCNSSALPLHAVGHGTCNSTSLLMGPACRYEADAGFFCTESSCTQGIYTSGECFATRPVLADGKVQVNECTEAGFTLLSNSHGWKLDADRVDLREEDGFGRSVASLGNDRIAVGAELRESASGRGAVYIIHLDDDGAKLLQTITDSDIPDIADLDFFGSSIASLGDFDG
jgi:hypothetical protein